MRNLALFGAWLWLSLAGLAQPRLIEPYLREGRLAQARMAVEQALERHAEVDELKFQLALVQFLQATEHLSQGMYRYGLSDSGLGISLPFLRFPVEANPEPQPVTNLEVRELLARLRDELVATSATLSAIPDDSDVLVPLRFGRIRLDLDGDGRARPEETLWRLFDRLYRGAELEEASAVRFGMRLDAGDARWLEGYCHLLAAVLETTLAYDTQRLFDHTGHLFFARAVSPFPFLRAGGHELNTLRDGIAWIHLLDLPVQDAPRMTAALSHLESVLALSRRSWRCILAETDDNFEWIPNPRQRGVLPESRVTPEMVRVWHQFLDEAEAILAGRLLLPFWRETEPRRGINLRRVFTQPARLDAVLWFQGTAAAPYLEAGPITPVEFWQRLSRTFEGNFRGWAAWFN